MPTKLTSYTILNTKKVKAWHPDGPMQGRCLWEYHDVWHWNIETNQAVILHEDYFSKHPDAGKKLDWYTNCYLPLAKRWSERVRKVSPKVLVFLEPIPNQVGLYTSFFYIICPDHFGYSSVQNLGLKNVDQQIWYSHLIGMYLALLWFLSQD